MAEQNINIGNLTSGAAAIGSGNATNTGPTHIRVFTQQKIEAVRAELAKLEAALHASEVDPVEKQRLLSHVQDAKDAPSPSKIRNVIELIGNLGTLAEAGHALAPYAAALGAFIGIS